MPAILIRCPSTGKPISTGHSAGSATAFENNDWVDVQTDCPHCPGVMHTWSKADAWLEGQEPKPAAGQ